jgi:hypothetical protein
MRTSETEHQAERKAGKIQRRQAPLAAFSGKGGTGTVLLKSTRSDNLKTQMSFRSNRMRTIVRMRLNPPPP